MVEEKKVPSRVLTSKRQPSLSGAIPSSDAQSTQAPIPLVNSSWEFCGDDAAKVLTENPDFHVVGVLGTQGCGRSTLLNCVAGLQGPRGAAAGAAFPQQTPADVLLQRHCTDTIGMQVHPQERIIALDTPPLFSLSVLSELMALDRVPAGLLSLPALRSLGRREVPYEALHYTMALQTACWMFGVCHVVLVLSDDLLDPLLLEFLQLVDVCLHGLPDPFPAPGVSAPAALQGRIADVVFVPTGLQPHQLHPSFLGPSVLQPLSEALAVTAFHRSETISMEHALRVHSLHPVPQPTCPPPPGINFFPLPLHTPLPPKPPLRLPATHAHDTRPPLHPPSDPSQPALTQHAPPTHAATPPPKGGRLPARSQPPASPSSAVEPPPGNQAPSQSDWAARLAPDQVAMELLRNQVLSGPRRPFPKAVSERAWLKGCEKLWEALARSSDVASVYRRVVRAGGGTAALWS